MEPDRGVRYVGVWEDLYYFPSLGVVAQVERRTAVSMGSSGWLPEDHFLCREMPDVYEQGFPEGLAQKNPRMSTMVELVPTLRCNMGCGYCYSASQRSDATMDPIVGMQAVDSAVSACMVRHLQTGKARSVSVHLHGGGEPTCAMGPVREIVQYAREQCARRRIGLGLSITTNGCMHRSALEWLAGSGFAFRVSIDGLSDDQDVQRPLASGSGSFGWVRRTVDELQERGAPFFLRATVTSRNVDNLPYFVKYVVGRWPEVQSIRFDPLQRVGGQDGSAMDVPPLDAYIRRWGECRRILTEGGFTDEGLTGGASVLSQHGTFGLCASMRFEQLVVGPDGVVTTCHEALDDQAYAYGRVERGLRLDPERITALKAEAKRDVETGSCSGCDFRYLCLGGCRHRRLGPSWDLFCKLTRHMLARSMREAIEGAPARRPHPNSLGVERPRGRGGGIVRLVCWGQSAPCAPGHRSGVACGGKGDGCAPA